MNKVIKYSCVIASVAGLAFVIAAGIKIADDNYDVINEGIAAGVCLAVLFIASVYKAAKQK